MDERLCWPVYRGLRSVMKQWTCPKCGLEKTEYKRRGLCNRCYGKERYQRNGDHIKAVRRACYNLSENERISRREAHLIELSSWVCPECGTSNRKNRAKGLCHLCYAKKLYQVAKETTPERLAKVKSDWYQKNKDYCNTQNKEYRLSHKEELASYFLECARKLKWEVIEKLGGECACCGEKRLEFLTVDHINGDGSEHRRSLASPNGKTSQGMIYKDIKKQGYPKDKFRVLCSNCNFSIGVWGYCPHTQRRLTAYPVKNPENLNKVERRKQYAKNN